MNEQTIKLSEDSKYFSQRAKHMSLLNRTTPSVHVKPLNEMHFQFSNRAYMSSKDIPIGRGGHGNILINESRQNVSIGRGRTTIPSSRFVLQKDDLSMSSSSSSTTTTTTKNPTSPIFVMHDEVQFVRPYFGPMKSIDAQSTSISRKREILLSALKEIELGLKTL